MDKPAKPPEDIVSRMARFGLLFFWIGAFAFGGWRMVAFAAAFVAAALAFCFLCEYLGLWGVPWEDEPDPAEPPR